MTQIHQLDYKADIESPRKREMESCKHSYTRTLAAPPTCTNPTVTAEALWDTLAPPNRNDLDSNPLCVIW